MLLLAVGLTLCTIVHGVVPPSTVCYQHTSPRNACLYGNLTVALIGKTLRPKDCNSPLTVSDFAHPPFIYINSTNTTERFTVVMMDTGPDGMGPAFLQWMVTNVSINTLPDYKHLRPGDTVADYREPLSLYGSNRPNLIQILVFRHQNVLRVPFGELFVAKRNNFDLSQLFSNTGPNLKLCGPVAGAQYWVYGSKDSMAPSAPLPPVPVQPHVPPQYGYAPVQPGMIVPPQSGYAPVQPVVPPQAPYVPLQPGLPSQPAQSAYNQLAQTGFIPAQVPHNPSLPVPHYNYPKKGSGNMAKPIILIYLFVLAVLFL